MNNVAERDQHVHEMKAVAYKWAATACPDLAD
jgi:hypothetical protein